MSGATARTTAPLAEGPVLVYDGDCRTCAAVARWTQRRVPAARVAPWQSLDLADLGLSLREAQRSAWWIQADGTRHEGHEAVAAALCAAGGAWQPLGKLLRLRLLAPGSRAIYGFVARNRSRLGCTSTPSAS